MVSFLVRFSMSNQARQNSPIYLFFVHIQCDWFIQPRCFTKHLCVCLSLSIYLSVCRPLKRVLIHYSYNKYPCFLQDFHVQTKNTPFLCSSLWDSRLFTENIIKLHVSVFSFCGKREPNLQWRVRDRRWKVCITWEMERERILLTTTCLLKRRKGFKIEARNGILGVCL